MARRILFACVFVALAAVACGDSNGPGGANGLVVVSGGGQSGHVNAALAQPLVVRATGAGGAAFPNATITWTVTSGSATLTPTSSQTDASGNASTTVTLGATAGAVVVSAATAGTTPVTFALTAVGPATLAVVSGSGQTGPVGGVMAESLRVSLTGTDGLPYAGGTIVWAVTAGAGTASPPQSVTGANGQATTLISPAAAGGLTITASSGTATPATFTGTGVPPCQYVRPYTLGDVVSGTLSTLDCGLNLGGAIYYYDFYNLVFAAQQSFTVSMSSAFDTWVDLLKPTGEVLGSNDDSISTVSNSHFEGIFGPGNYVIGASSYEPVTTGPYTVRSAARASTIAQCRVIWGVRPIVITETIMATDCIDASSGSTFYSDRLALALDAGVTLEVRMTSGAVDPSLYLYDVFGGVIVASNNDSSAGNPTAFLTYAVPADGLFFLDAGTAVAGQTGAYTLTVAGTTVAGAAGSGVAASAWRIPAAFGRGAVGKAPLQIRMPLRARLAAGEGGGPK
jgi:hypothetical protein